MKKSFVLFLTFVLVLTFTACSNSSVKKESKPNANKTGDSYNELPEIISLDKKMSNYFDISLFDEENYSNIYLDKKFKINANYNDKNITVPTTVEELAKIGFVIQEGSEYNENSYIFANETVQLNFVDENSSFSALFYNSGNKSVRLSKCKIAKIRLENSHNTKNIIHFFVNGINNDSTVTDVISTLGTPSHFYAIDDENYYFDYFITKSDRRNKIRVFVNLTNDCVNAVEVSFYK